MEFVRALRHNTVAASLADSFLTGEPGLEFPVITTARGSSDDAGDGPDD
jgi:hypothetical protein